MNITQISIENILKNGSPEQLILWSELLSKFGERISVRPLFYAGPIAGTEFLSGDPRKIFLAFDIKFSHSGVSIAFPPFSALFMDELANPLYFSISNLIYWNGAAERFNSYSVVEKNVWFCNFAVDNFTYMVFNGFRIGI